MRNSSRRGDRCPLGNVVIISGAPTRTAHYWQSVEGRGPHLRGPGSLFRQKPRAKRSFPIAGLLTEINHFFYFEQVWTKFFHSAANAYHGSGRRAARARAAGSRSASWPCDDAAKRPIPNVVPNHSPRVHCGRVLPRRIFVTSYESMRCPQMKAESSAGRRIARERGHQTQWAAQFAVASELCKRGYEVSFSVGNSAPRRRSREEGGPGPRP